LGFNEAFHFEKLVKNRRNIITRTQTPVTRQAKWGSPGNDSHGNIREIDERRFEQIGSV
jgi:hypothetical protein